MPRILGLLSKLFVSEYWIGRVYGMATADCPEPRQDRCVLGLITDYAEVRRNPDREVSRRAENYAMATDCWCYGAWVDGELAAVCWFWAGDTYRRHRNFWPLKEGDAKLIEIATDSRFRGRGIGTKLIQYGTCKMRELGFRRVFARVWHSNTASNSIFEKAGYKCVAYELMVHPHFVGRQLRFFARTGAHKQLDIRTL